MKKQVKKEKSIPIRDLIKELNNKKHHWYDEVYWWVRYGIWTKLHDLPKEIKWFIQRGKRGYADCDTWSLCSYLPEVIFKSVEHLSKHLCSHPCDVTFKQWKIILKKIVNSFKIMQQTIDGTLLYLPTKKWTDKEYLELQNLARRMNRATKAMNLEEKYKVMTKKQAFVYEEGLRLFVENLGGLWD